MAATPADQPLDPDRDLSQEELVADIEQTRAQLGDTVDALAQKFDVKARPEPGLMPPSCGFVSR